MLSRKDMIKVKKVRSYEQYIEDYKQWRKVKTNNSFSDKKKSLIKECRD